MNFSIHSPAVPSENVTTGTMLCELETALDRNYQKIRESARTRWQAIHGNVGDPSDACVSVRITSRATERATRGAGLLLPAKKIAPSLGTGVWPLAA
ncbi:MAG: hypothetical protein ACJ8KU_10760 [Chthoniobacterales bacterium]|jgi:hypothetical protein